MHISDLETPSLVLDKSRLLKNLGMMSNKASKHHVSLRPHIKTHKCIEIAKLQREYGCQGITVSTLEEAEVFASNGFHDITYAVPLDAAKTGKMVDLNQSEIVRAIVDSPQSLDMLDSKAREAGKIIEVLVKVDTGYHRCGVDPKDHASIRLAESVVGHRNLLFAGILTHAGHSYACTSIPCILKVASEEQGLMLDFARRLREHNHNLSPETISIGSTPTTTLCKSFEEGITEIRPGSYVYHDYTQVRLGVCNIADCALSVIARIIGMYNGRAVIDAGATALSKDEGPVHIEPECGFGKIYDDYDRGTLLEQAKITGLSQEHGKITLETEACLSPRTIGDYVRILPNHSCLTNNMFREAHVVEKDRVIDTWQIFSGHS
jgi:D-serine deaminase-like pyridoxal phosphate-dependent protein